MARLVPFSKIVLVSLSCVYLFTQVVFAYKPETDFWKVRQDKVKLARSVPILQKPVSLLPSSKLRPIPKILSSSSQNKFKKILIELSGPWGTLRDVSLPSGSNPEKIVIYIQDVHMNFEAQANIGKGLKRILNKQLASGVALEGAFNELDLTPFQTYSDQKSVRAVADYLLKNHKITGPIHAILTDRPRSTVNGRPFIIGVDDKKHYKANVEAVKTAWTEKEEIKAEWKKNGQILLEQKNKTFNLKLKQFDNTIQAYRSNTISFGLYLKEISQQSKNKPHVTRFLNALKLEQSLNYQLVERQRSQFLASLIQKLNPLKTKEFMEIIMAYRLETISHAAFYGYLENISDGHGMALYKYPELKSYIQYVLTSDNIDASEIFKEARGLEEETYGQLIQNKQEKELVGIDRQFYLTGKLIDLALTREEWDEYKETTNYERRDTKKELINKLPSSSFVFRSSSFKRFYAEAEVRDKAMASNLIRAMRDNKSDVMVLVTGGFHSKGIQEKLLDKNIAVLTYVPTVTKIKTENGSAYLNIFMQQKTPLEKLFEGDKLFLAQEVEPSVKQARLVTPILSVGLGRVKNKLLAFQHFGLEFIQARVSKVGQIIKAVLNLEEPKNIEISMEVDDDEELVALTSSSVGGILLGPQAVFLKLVGLIKSDWKDHWVTQIISVSIISVLIENILLGQFFEGKTVWIVFIALHLANFLPYLSGARAPPWERALVILPVAIGYTLLNVSLEWSPLDPQSYLLHGVINIFLTLLNIYRNKHISRRNDPSEEIILEDLTSDYLGDHPFPLRVFHGPKKKRTFVETFQMKVIPERFIISDGIFEAGGGEAVSILGELSELLDIPSEKLFQDIATGHMNEITGKTMANVKSPILISLLTKARAIGIGIKEAKVLAPVEGFQATMSVLAGENKSYATLVQTVNHILANPKKNSRRPQNEKSISLEDIAGLDFWMVKGGNSTYVAQGEVKLVKKKGLPKSVRFVVNMPTDATLASNNIRGAYSNLQFAFHEAPESIVEPYGLYEGNDLPILLAEWLEDYQTGESYHELHLYGDKGDLFHVWWNQNNIRAPVSRRESNEIWRQTIRLISKLSDYRNASDEGIWHHPVYLSAGDMVGLRKGKNWDVVQIWIREEKTGVMQIEEFFDVLIKGLAMEATDGDAYIRFQRPDIALGAVIEGQMEKIQTTEGLSEVEIQKGRENILAIINNFLNTIVDVWKERLASADSSDKKVSSEDREFYSTAVPVLEYLIKIGLFEKLKESNDPGKEAQKIIESLMKTYEQPQGVPDVSLPKSNVVPTVTPVKEGPDQTLELDEKAVPRYFKFLKTLGVVALMVVGATGEFTAMTRELRQKAVQVMTREAKAAGLFAIANITGVSKTNDVEEAMQETIENAKMAEKEGADVIVFAPYVILEKGQSIEPYIDRIRAEVNVPLALYNNPGIHRIKKSSLPADEIGQLFKSGKIVAIKDSSGSMDQLRSYIATGVSVYQGDEGHIAEALEAGAIGSVGSTGNILELLQRLAKEQDPERRAFLQAELLTMRDHLTVYSNKISSGIKYLLAKQGIMNDIPIESDKALTDQEKADIDWMSDRGQKIEDAIQITLIGQDPTRESEWAELFKNRYKIDPPKIPGRIVSWRKETPSASA